MPEKGEKMKLKRGCRYVTRGGWECEVIWEYSDSVFVDAIHFPPDGQDKIGIYQATNEQRVMHRCDNGAAFTSFSVSEPPSWGKHPADIVREKR